MPTRRLQRRASERRVVKCHEMLVAEAEKPITTVVGLASLIKNLVGCFLDTSEVVYKMADRLFGNGDVGMDEQLRILATRVNEHDERMEKHETEEKESIRTAVKEAIHEVLDVKDAKDKKTKTSFDKMIDWFVQKILPNLVTALITALVAWIIAVNVLLQQHAP